jgi:very-short-patch-repair endonuclease
MTVTDVLRILGGVASRSVLLGATSRAALEAALSDGSVVRIARGRYALPEAHEGLVVATRAGGVVCLASAALSYGWAVKTVPVLPHVALPKHRRLADGVREQLVPHWIDLDDSDLEGAATSQAKTLEMCGRWLPFDVAGLTVRPQVTVCGEVMGLHARPDLVDEDLRLVLEADSFEWHGDRVALRDDARRYDLMVVNGWRVLRFAWEDVMFDQAWVREVLTAAVAERTQRCSSCFGTD